MAIKKIKEESEKYKEKGTENWPQWEGNEQNKDRE